MGKTLKQRKWYKDTIQQPAKPDEVGKGPMYFFELLAEKGGKFLFETNRHAYKRDALLLTKRDMQRLRRCKNPVHAYMGGTMGAEGIAYMEARLQRGLIHTELEVDEGLKVGIVPLNAQERHQLEDII